MNPKKALDYQARRVADRRDRKLLVKDDPELYVLKYLKGYNELHKLFSEYFPVDGEIIGKLRDILDGVPKMKFEAIPNKWSFDDFFTAYGKKIDRYEAEARWNKLTNGEKDKVMAHVPGFVLANPDRKFRPSPARYLLRRKWEDEIVGEEAKPVPVVNKKWLQGVE
jgi:hypothetical protein